MCCDKANLVVLVGEECSHVHCDLPLPSRASYSVNPASPKCVAFKYVPEI